MFDNPSCRGRINVTRELVLIRRKTVSGTRGASRVPPMGYQDFEPDTCSLPANSNRFEHGTRCFPTGERLGNFEISDTNSRWRGSLETGIRPGHECRETRVPRPQPIPTVLINVSLGSLFTTRGNKRFFSSTRHRGVCVRRARGPRRKKDREPRS